MLCRGYGEGTEERVSLIPKSILKSILKSMLEFTVP